MKKDQGKTKKTPKKKAHYYLILSLILIFALVIRIIYLNQLKLNYPYFFEPLKGADMRTYILAGKDIAEGTSNKEAFLSSTSFYIYKYFLALIFKIFGFDLYKARLFQTIFLGLGTLSIIFYIGKLLFNEKVGLLAAGGSAICGIFIVYENVFLSEMLWTFLASLLLLSLAIFTKTKQRIFIILAGISLGMATLVRPNIILLIFGVIFGLFYSLRLKLKKTFYLSFIFLISIFSCFLFFFFLHYLQYHNLSFTAPAGLTFSMGNNRYAKGWFQYTPHDDELQKLAGKLNISVDKMRREDVLCFIKNEPLRWLRLLAKKFCMFWDDWEIANNIDYDQMKDYSFVLRLPIILTFGVIAPLGLLGMVINLKNRRRLVFLYLYVIMFTFSVIIVFVCGRYRVPIVPCLLIFAGSCIYNIYKKLKYKNYLQLIFIGFLFLIFYLFCNSRLILSWVVPLICPHGIYERNISQDSWINILKSIYVDKKSSQIAYKNFQKTQLIIRDDSDNWHGGDGMTLSWDKQKIKKILILKDWDRLKPKEAFLRLAIVSNTTEGGLLISINGKPLPFLFPSSQLPHQGLVGTGDIKVPIEYFKEGENVITLEVRHNGSIFIPVDDYYRFGRSFYYDGKNWHKIKGEYRIQLKLISITV